LLHRAVDQGTQCNFAFGITGSQSIRVSDGEPRTTEYDRVERFRGFPGKQDLMVRIC
jgi:hypothetical protein